MEKSLGNSTPCVLANIDRSGRVNTIAPSLDGQHRHVKLERCSRLTGDWEIASRPWEAGVGPLAATLSSVRRLALRKLELRNVQLSRHGLEHLAAALAGTAECTAAGPSSRAPLLRRLVLENNGLLASDMPALAGLLAAIPSLHAVCLRSNLIGDDGVRTLYELWPRGATLQALELTDAAVGPSGFAALMALAGRSTGGAHADTAGCFNLTLMHNEPGMLRTPAAAHAGIFLGMPPAHAGRGGGGWGRRRKLLNGHRHARGFERHGGAGRASERAEWAAASDAPTSAVVGSLALGLASSRLHDGDAPNLATLLRRFEWRESAQSTRASAAAAAAAAAVPAASATAVPPPLTLTALDVSGNELGDESARAITTAASRLPRLAVLNARDNPVGADGFLSLLSLAVHPSLASLHLPTPADWRSLERRHVRRAVAIFEALGPGSALRELRFKADWLGRQPEAMLALAASLRKGNALTSLDLSTARMGADAAAALAAALASPTCQLVSLTLDENYLSVASVVALARALANNTRLRHLGLDHNNVGVAGTRALLQSARSSGALLSVSTMNAGVGFKVGGLLQEQLQANLAQSHG